jgi:hypothetical protein
MLKSKKAEGKVHTVLSDRRMVLKLALLSLTESMRKDPDKFGHLIYNNNTSSIPPRTQATDYLHWKTYIHLSVKSLYYIIVASDHAIRRSQSILPIFM